MVIERKNNGPYLLQDRNGEFLRNRIAAHRMKSCDVDESLAESKVVKAILNHRLVNNKQEYLVAWSHTDETTWEPYANFDDVDIIRRYWGQVATADKIRATPTPTLAALSIPTYSAPERRARLDQLPCRKHFQFATISERIELMQSYPEWFYSNFCCCERTARYEFMQPPYGPQHCQQTPSPSISHVSMSAPEPIHNLHDYLRTLNRASTLARGNVVISNSSSQVTQTEHETSDSSLETKVGPLKTKSSQIRNKPVARMKPNRKSFKHEARLSTSRDAWCLS